MISLIEKFEITSDNHTWNENRMVVNKLIDQYYIWCGATPPKFIPSLKKDSKVLIQWMGTKPSRCKEKTFKKILDKTIRQFEHMEDSGCYMNKIKEVQFASMGI